MPAELSDLNVVRLALGDIFALMTADDLTPAEYARLTADPQIKERAKAIALRELARLADGEKIDETMQWLLAIWCRQQARSGSPGRTDGYVKETAVCSAFYKKMHKDPYRKRESIVQELMNEFDLKRRRVFDILKNAGPRRRR
jgi:hypothetical protein